MSLLTATQSREGDLEARVVGPLFHLGHRLQELETTRPIDSIKV
jgi:hypothetical protein